MRATASNDIPPPGVDYSRKWFVMVAVAMGVFLGTIDGSIVNVALPTLVREFDTTFPVVQWVVLGYLLAISTLTLMVGRLGDMIGKKPIYTAGFGMFTGASMLCGLSPSVEWLIGFRILQAVGASMVVALGLAILTEAFPPSERGRALGITGTMVSIGIALGPSLGGLLIDTLSWHWIFFVNLPVGIAGTVAAIRFVPDVPPPGGQRFDVPGAFTLFTTLLTLLLALTLGQEQGFASTPIVALFATSAISLTVFITVERRVRQPIIDLGLFRNGLLSVNLITGFATFISIAGLLILLPFYLEGVLGFDPGKTGLLLGVAPVALGIVAPISGSLSDRYGTRPVTVAGLAIMTAAYLGLSTLRVDSTTLHYVLLALPLGAGIGVFQSPNNSAIIGRGPPRTTRHRIGDAVADPTDRPDHRDRRARRHLGVAGFGCRRRAHHSDRCPGRRSGVRVAGDHARRDRADGSGAGALRMGSGQGRQAASGGAGSRRRLRPPRLSRRQARRVRRRSARPPSGPT